jgi:hypothetical protein
MRRASIFVLLAAGCDVSQPTWNDDLAPVVERHCLACHQAGGNAPFALSRYEDVAPLAAQLADAVESGSMPPFPAAPGCQPYRDERRLTEEEQALFRRFANAGAPRGEGQARTTAPPQSAGLPQVDLEIRGEEPYTPKKLLGDDDYHCVAGETGLGRDAHVVAFDVVPDRVALVHHMLLYKTTAARAQAADDAEEGPGWTCFGGPATGDFDLVGAWAPGTGPVRFPEGSGILVGADQRLVMQIHYNTTSAPAEPDQSAVQLELSDGPVARGAELPIIADTGFLIPAGATGYTHTFERTVPFAARLWSVGAHMHLLGRSVRVSVLRGGAETCLLDIPSWTFHHQLSYSFDTQEGLPLADGDELKISCTWDNPGAAPVGFGESTTDEMCVAFVYLTREG